MFQSTARWQINSYMSDIKKCKAHSVKAFQSTARWQINSYLPLSILHECKHATDVSIDGTLADQFLHFIREWFSMGVRDAFQSTARWQINSYLWFLWSRSLHNKISCFNRRHAGRSILTLWLVRRKARTR